MSELWQGLIAGLGSVLEFFHDAAEPVFGVFAWGWAIVLLTLAVRVVLLPLAVKQTRSMRAMQKLGPEIKKIQAKYKTDRSMMRSDPDKFRERRQKQQEETMALYREHGANPATSCLPLIAQMPVFFALFTLLRDARYVPELDGAPWYLVDNLATLASAAGIGAWLLIALMGATTFFSQRQMMASNPTMADQPQQRVLLYVMPAMLTVFGVNFPVGVLLYWVTTNLWTMGQQYVMLRGARDVGGARPATAAAVAPSTGGGDSGAAPGDKKGRPTPKRGGSDRGEKGQGAASSSGRSSRSNGKRSGSRPATPAKQKRP